MHMVRMTLNAAVLLSDASCAATVAAFPIRAERSRLSTSCWMTLSVTPISRRSAVERAAGGSMACRRRITSMGSIDDPTYSSMPSDCGRSHPLLQRPNGVNLRITISQREARCLIRDARADWERFMRRKARSFPTIAAPSTNMRTPTCRGLWMLPRRSCRDLIESSGNSSSRTSVCPNPGRIIDFRTKADLAGSISSSLRDLWTPAQATGTGNAAAPPLPAELLNLHAWYG